MQERILTPTSQKRARRGPQFWRLLSFDPIPARMRKCFRCFASFTRSWRARDTAVTSSIRMPTMTAISTCATGRLRSRAGTPMTILTYSVAGCG